MPEGQREREGGREGGRAARALSLSRAREMAGGDGLGHTSGHGIFSQYKTEHHKEWVQRETRCVPPPILPPPRPPRPRPPPPAPSRSAPGAPRGGPAAGIPPTLSGVGDMHLWTRRELLGRGG